MQNTYILLRNNVESAPLTLDGLKKIGLLPTDLLWVECQSVCWQHPGEIRELKDLVTDQQIKPANSTAEELFQQYTPQYKDKPGELKKETPLDLSVPETSAKADFTQKKTVAPVFNDILLDEAVQQPMTTRVRTKPDRAAVLESLLHIPAKKAALYAGLIVAGAIMMFIIMGTGKNNTPPAVTAISKPVAVADTMTAEPEGQSTEIPIPEEQTTPTPESYNQPNVQINEKNPAPVTAKVSATNTDQKIPQNNKQVTKKIPGSTEPQQPAANQPVVTETPKERTPPEENIAAALKLSANEYNVAAFGGIKNLKLTLENNSSSFLSKVSVEIRYLNPEGAVVKTDAIDFTLLRPGSSSTVAVKKSGRGVKVDYRVLRYETGQP